MAIEPTQERHLASPLQIISKENSDFRSVLLNRDLWSLEELGVEAYKHRYDYNLNFSKIKQPWLKELAKKYVLLRVARRAKPGTLSNHLTTINHLSNFLLERCVVSIEEINNEVLLGFVAYLKSNFLHSTAHTNLSSFKVFLEVGTNEGWFQIPTTVLRNKIPPREVSNDAIEVIPDYILKKLDENLYRLPIPLQRAVILLRTLGLRIGEMLTLSLHCLKENKRGEFEIQVLSSKANDTKDWLPILPEIARIIREQQDYIRQELGDDWPYLFCGSKRFGASKFKRVDNFSPNRRVMSAPSFTDWLNTLETKDSKGNLWHFRTHQFRRTFATKLLEANVRHYIISRYLRHLSPEMIQNYVFVSPELQKELVEIRKSRKTVDVAGKHVEILNSDFDEDLSLEWLRSRMQPKALAMGFCARPDLLKPCPHVNACLSCQHYRLDEGDLPALRAHLERTKLLRTESESKNYSRQVDGIKKDEETLEKIIAELEMEF